jgi:uncharacterized protein
LVAGLDRRDEFHEWALAQIKQVPGPLLTCDAVLSEACFLLRETRDGVKNLMGLLRQGAVRPVFGLEDETHAVADLIERYLSIPMSFADACLVRMTELYPKSRLLTLDRDFTIYRKNRRQAIPLIMPTT